MNIIDRLTHCDFPKRDIPFFKAGDTVRVHCKIQEGDKERIQVFQGIVIARKNNGVNSTFTVRKVSFGIGVERIFLLHSPSIDKIEPIISGKVRRAKLYYLRNLSGKKAKVAEKRRLIVASPETKDRTQAQIQPEPVGNPAESAE